MICPNCKQAVPDSAKVCGYCGYRLGTPVSEPSQPSSIRQQAASIPAPQVAFEKNKKKNRLWLIPVIIFGVILLMGISWFGPGRFFALAARIIAPPTATAIPTTIPTALVQAPAQAEALLATNVSYPEIILVEPFSEEEGILRLSALVDEDSPGNYSGSFPYNTPVSFGVRTCSPTNEDLSNDILGIRYWNWYVDGRDVTVDMTRETIITDENACLYLRGIIRSWPLGTHTLRFIADDNDGKLEWNYTLEITTE